MRIHFAAVPIALLILFGVRAVAGEGRVHSDEQPAVLVNEVPDGITALALSPDGLRMAYALPGVIHRLESPSREAVVVEVRGTIRDLLFLDDNRTLVGLQYRPAKKQEGDTFFFTWDGDAKIRRIMRVPPSSSDLDRWPGGNAILLACRNEIRTILLPEFRSGPLFGLPGDNLAVTSLGSSALVLIGRRDEVSLIDISAPSGREAMPVLARQPVDAPVAALADSPDGDEVLVRLADGRLYLAAFDPPGFEPSGSADWIAGLAKATHGPLLPFVPAPAVREEKPVVEPTPVAEPAVVAPRVPAETTAVHQLHGTIGGSFDLVTAVVLLGPNNILEEAARVRPAKDGAWWVDGLAPGRYRVQLDAGGESVLVVVPRFLMVEVGEQPTRAPEIKVLRSF